MLPPFQWSMFKINELETLDTAFYRCEASNAAESVHSDAIVQVSQIFENKIVILILTFHSEKVFLYLCSWFT